MLPAEQALLLDAEEAVRQVLAEQLARDHSVAGLAGVAVAVEDDRNFLHCPPSRKCYDVRQYRTLY